MKKMYGGRSVASNFICAMKTSFICFGVFLKCFLSQRVIIRCSTGVGKRYSLWDMHFMTYGAEQGSSN